MVIFDNNHEKVWQISIQTLKSPCSYHIFLGLEPCDIVATCMLVDNTVPNAFTEFALKKSYVPSGVQSRKRLLFCQPKVQSLHQMQTSNYYEYRARTGPGKPGKSWNFILAFSIILEDKTTVSGQMPKLKVHVHNKACFYRYQKPC